MDVLNSPDSVLYIFDTFCAITTDFYEITADGFGYSDRLRGQEKVNLGRKVTFCKSVYFGTVGSFLEMLNVPKSSMHDIVLSNLDGFYAIVTSWVVRMPVRGHRLLKYRLLE